MTAETGALARNRHGRATAATPSGRGAHLGYRPALDGLRAVAVLAVMLYHGGVSWTVGGFLGVDVFFVLSGFLITSLLVKEWSRTGRIGLRAFWLRRARRLLPAVILMLLAVLAYAVVVPQQQAGLRGASLSTLAYVSNWWFMLSGQSYFAQFVEPSMLRHTWSLAIEEQFYILFPLVLVALLGRLRLRTPTLRVVLLGGAITSAVLMAALYDPASDPSRAYYGTDTRMQALLLGAVLALSPSLLRPRKALYARVGGRLVPVPGAGLLGVVALGGLLAMVVVARELAPWMYRGGFLLAAALSAVVIASVTAAPRSALGRVLSWRPVVAVGVLSYGLYLWHWPVFIALSHDRTGLDGPSLLFARFAVTGVLALVSFRLVEEPIRTQRLQRRFTPTQWSRTVVAATVGVVAATLLSTASAEPVGGRRKQPVVAPLPCRTRRVDFGRCSSSVTPRRTGCATSTATGWTGSPSAAVPSWAAARSSRSGTRTARRSRTSRRVRTGNPGGPRRWPGRSQTWWCSCWGSASSTTAASTAGSWSSARPSTASDCTGRWTGGESSCRRTPGTSRSRPSCAMGSAPMPRTRPPGSPTTPTASGG